MGNSSSVGFSVEEVMMLIGMGPRAVPDIIVWKSGIGELFNLNLILFVLVYIILSL